MNGRMHLFLQGDRVAVVRTVGLCDGCEGGGKGNKRKNKRTGARGVRRLLSMATAVQC